MAGTVGTVQDTGYNGTIGPGECQTGQKKKEEQQAGTHGGEIVLPNLRLSAGHAG